VLIATLHCSGNSLSPFALLPAGQPACFALCVTNLLHLSQKDLVRINISSCRLEAFRGVDLKQMNKYKIDFPELFYQ
jgi:hypothetical protein